MNDLSKIAAALGDPVNYFAGTGDAPWCWPLKIIAFSRKTRGDLQRRTSQSRLHTRFVLVLNLETPGTLNLDSTPYRLNPGQAHLVFPHALHTYHDVEREKILWLFITFDLPDETPLRALRKRTVEIDRKTRGMLVELLSDYRSKKGEPHQMQALLSGILLRLAHSAQRGSTAASAGPQAHEKFLQNIHRHHARKLPDVLHVGELAALMKISESRLRARFRETFGQSLGAYLRNLRLQDAIAMMRHSEASLTDIALSCAFGSSSAFSRAFRSWAGTTPREFRRSLAKPSTKT